MGLHLALQEGKQGRYREKNNPDRSKITQYDEASSQEGLFPGGRARLWGDDLQLSQDRTVCVLQVPGLCQTMHGTHCNAGTRGWDCSHIPGACAALLGPGLRRILKHTGQGERSTHRQVFGLWWPRLQRLLKEEQPQRFWQPHTSSICFWGTFVPNLSPVSWSYYKQVQSALPLLFR